MRSIITKIENNNVADIINQKNRERSGLIETFEQSCREANDLTFFYDYTVEDFINSLNEYCEPGYKIIDDSLICESGLLEIDDEVYTFIITEHELSESMKNAIEYEKNMSC